MHNLAKFAVRNGNVVSMLSSVFNNMFEVENFDSTLFHVIESEVVMRKVLDLTSSNVATSYQPKDNVCWDRSINEVNGKVFQFNFASFPFILNRKLFYSNVL